MKKGIAIILTIMISGASCCWAGNVSAAGQIESGIESNEKKLFENDSQVGEGIVPENSLQDSEDNSKENQQQGSEIKSEENQSQDSKGESQKNDSQDDGKKEFQEDILQTPLPTENGDLPQSTPIISDEEIADVHKTDRDSIGIVRIQIPQKLGIVIDTWELEERGQIYSDDYIIWNAGDTAGRLVLTGLACKTEESEHVVVRTDKEGLHNNEDTSVYIEMALGNGDNIIFSEDGSEYEIVLEPGEELSFYFTGEVNENAAQPLGAEDIEVKILYSWDVERIVPELDTPDTIMLPDTESSDRELTSPEVVPDTSELAVPSAEPVSGNQETADTDIKTEEKGPIMEGENFSDVGSMESEKISNKPFDIESTQGTAEEVTPSPEAKKEGEVLPVDNR